MLELGKQFYRTKTITIIEQGEGGNLDLDYKYGITKTGIKYFGDDVYSTVIDLEGQQLFQGGFISGYTAAIRHNLRIDKYVAVQFQKTTAAVNDPFGGEFQNFEAVFGFADIRRLADSIQLKITPEDEVIELTGNYRFHIWFTQLNEDE